MPDLLCKHAPAILRHAADIIDQRGKERDQPDGERTMRQAVAVFRALTNITMTEKEGWLFMVVLKLARSTRGYNPDDYIDGAAYLALALECINQGDD
jgi:Domain of unknown function (DUF6378)